MVLALQSKTGITQSEKGITFEGHYTVSEGRVIECGDGRGGRKMVGGQM